MTLDPSVFKAYDVRGTYPDQIDEDGARRVGAAFIEVTGARRVAVGHDARTMAPSMCDAFIAGAAAAGAEVTGLGLVATEMLYFAVADGGFDAGAAVTASHNPPGYTGAKLVRAGAVPLSGDTGIAEVGRIALAEAAPPDDRGAAHSDTGLLERFTAKCMSFVDPAAISGLKVVVDASNGMAGLYLPPVLEQLDIEAIPYYLEIDGTFPNHAPNPLEEQNRQFIQSKVKEHGADLGLAFDGDADRCFFIDASGEFVPGDFLTALLADHLLRREGAAPVVYDLRASWAVPQTIAAAGGTAYENRVGHAFIKTRMREVDALFAGEVSGHYYFRDFTFADSGLIPALLVMELLANRGRPLGEMIDEYRERFHISGEINSEVADTDATIQTLRERYADGRQYELDGLSVAYDDWHFNVRPSNTEPLLRLNLESVVSEDDMVRRRDEVLEIIRGG